MKLLHIVVLTFTFELARAQGESEISSPKVNNWGDWGSWGNCPRGKFVVAMRLKTEQPVGSGPSEDDTALNGIRLQCGSRYGGWEETISSVEGEWGNWGREFRCAHSTFATGFQLRSEDGQGTGVRNGDDTAANNLRLICDNGLTTLQGDGLSWGSWTSMQECPYNTAICGLQTQVEMPQGAGDADDTALNNVKMKCCPFQ